MAKLFKDLSQKKSTTDLNKCKLRRHQTRSKMMTKRAESTVTVLILRSEALKCKVDTLTEHEAIRLITWDRLNLKMSLLQFIKTTNSIRSSIWWTETWTINHHTEITSLQILAVLTNYEWWAKWCDRWWQFSRTTFKQWLALIPSWWQS